MDGKSLRPTNLSDSVSESDVRQFSDPGSSVPAINASESDEPTPIAPKTESETSAAVVGLPGSLG
jgi:hypothetical protein